MCKMIMAILTHAEKHLIKLISSRDRNIEYSMLSAERLASTLTLRNETSLSTLTLLYTTVPRSTLLGRHLDYKGISKESSLSLRKDMILYILT